MFIEASSVALDEDLQRHSEDVAALAVSTAARLGLDGGDLEVVRRGALLHDVGKTRIPRHLLSKPGRLTAAEFAIVSWHPRIGAHLVDAPQAIREVILHHHERFDGNGYPDGLARSAIPQAARIVSVADAYSAMLADRPYRRGRTEAEALDELERCAGTQFDPDVVRMFVHTVGRQRTTVNDGLVGAR